MVLFRSFLVCITFLAVSHPCFLYASTCTPTVSSGGSIQSAIDAASSGDTICVGVGTYTQKLTLKDGVILKGEELARTVIDGGGSGTVITGAGSAGIYNVTIKNGDKGISASSIIGLTISNVIIVGNGNGISCESSTSVMVSNSVIDQNTASGIYMANSSVITIQNSILSNNIVDISGDGTSSYSSEYNLVYGNTTTYYPSDNTTSKYDDPVFADTASNDYHLKSGSPAIDAGTGSDQDGTAADIGAYGGAAMDTTPFPVSGLSASSTADSSITMSWTANDAYSIAGYRVYFDSDGSREPYDGSATEGTSPIDAGNTTSITLSGLPLSTVTTPTAPDGIMTSPGNGSIAVSWNAVTDATGYKVYYGTSAGSYSQNIDAGSATSYTIEGLTNGTTYYIAVSSYNSTVYYLAVTAYDSSGYESSLLAENEATASLSNKTESAFSGEVTEYPEESIPFPNLKDEGLCFIATAAYGSNLEQGVAILREFRNHILLTNPIGKAFVNTYYQVSPPLADFIRDNELLRFFVRVSLVPVIYAAKFTLETSLLQKFIFLAFIGLFTTAIIFGRRMKNLKHLVLILSFLLIPSMAAADSSGRYFSINGGYSKPSIEGWDKHYNEDGVWTGGVEQGIKLTERLEVGIGISYSRIEGTSTTPTGRMSADKTVYEQIPVNLSLSYRLMFYDNQFIVPYIGGGYTHFIFREKINDQKLSGDLSGYHARGGLQILLDYLDPEAARHMAVDWDVNDTYLTFETLYSKVDDFGKEKTDLGGIGYFVGLRFDY